jgi:membrane protease YdiL (CAAX protease family)
MNQPTETTHSRVNYTEVIVYYILACAVSWPFFAWRDLYPESWKTFDFEYKHMLYMWGPACSALICFIIFRKSHKRHIMFWGFSIWRSLLFYFLPLLLWGIMMQLFPTEHDMTPLALLKLAFTGFLMILGEELGWRGFLQDTLRPLSEPKRWIVLGVMWEMWHFTRGLVNATPVEMLMRKSVMLASVMILAFIIGKLTERTRALMVAITLHAWFNIMFEFPAMHTFITMGINVLIWFGLLYKWKSPTEYVQN